MFESNKWRVNKQWSKVNAVDVEYAVLVNNDFLENYLVLLKLHMATGEVALACRQ